MLKVLTLQQIMPKLLERFCRTNETECVNIAFMLNRVCAKNIVSNIDIPPYNRSLMDGYAVLCEDTFGASESFPALLNLTNSVKMGEFADYAVNSGECVAIPTGGCLPKNADAVVMIEHTEKLDDNTVLIYKPVAVFENVVRAGEDLHSGELIIKAGKNITPADIGAMSGAGVYKACVLKKLKIGIISTGNEIIGEGDKYSPGKIYEINGRTLCAACEQDGFYAEFYGIIPDDFEQILKTLKTALNECDCVLLSGGSSVGTLDYTYRVFEKMGADLILNGLAVKPGKPTICAEIMNKPVFGLPGHPVSAYMIYKVCVAPLLLYMSGIKHVPVIRSAVFAENYATNAGRDEFVPVRLMEGYAYPVRAKSGMFATLTTADGYIHIPRNTEGILAGTAVEVVLF